MNVLSVAVPGRGLLRPGEPVFRADDEALLRGRAAFETTRVYGGRPFLLDRHVERLRASAERLRLPPPDPDECAHLARVVIDGAGRADLALRLYWTGMTLVATAGAIDPELDALRARGIRLAVVRWSTGALAGAKSTSYAENMGAQDVAVAIEMLVPTTAWMSVVSAVRRESTSPLRVTSKNCGLCVTTCPYTALRMSAVTRSPSQDTV